MLRETPKELPGELKRINDSEYAFAIAVTLKQEVGDSRHAAKKLARMTGASERTVQNWLSAVRGPSGLHLIRLAQNLAAVRAAMMRLTSEDAHHAEVANAVV
ncbi:transcriptional regulator with XRE-family HTH domain [Paraburkholderia sp. GAS448]|uniref:hypothetical protein n=1 Tax=Paraburkholderia sp. GAS448 TaxID=3035136 RepID=UPI003D190014